MKIERRESLENNNVTAESMLLWRRPPSCREASNTRTGGEHRGSGDGMSAKEKVVNTGNPIRWEEIPTAVPRGTDRAESGGGEVGSSNEASNDRGAKGP